jgi:site-specific DNA recombinase
MNALKPRSAFQTLIMSEESRLGREAIETGYVLKQIIDAGVRVFFYLEDRERTLDTAMDKVMLSLTNFASEVEREKVRQRTYDAMLRKAKALHVTGGRVYGYDNVEVLSPTLGPDGRAKRLHVMRCVNREQASVVRRIFEIYAAGLGVKRIADMLNKERVAPPRGSRGWATSGIREMLYRELYRGVVVWNKSQKTIRGGTAAQRRRPEEEWLRIEAPDLRIVPEDVWLKVHVRLDRARLALPRSLHGGRLIGRPSYLDGDSPYLLTGFTKCSVCGGAIGSIPRSHGTGTARQRVDYYGCFTNHRRGGAICANKAHIRQDALDSAVLAALNEALNERVIETAVEKALARLRSGQSEHLERRPVIERELSLIQAHENHLLDAIKRGEAVELLVAALKNEEERKKALVAELASLAGAERVASLDTDAIKRDVQNRVADVKDLLIRHTPQARQMLRKLLDGKLELAPIETGGGRGYRFTGSGRRVLWWLADRSKATGEPVHRRRGLPPRLHRSEGLILWRRTRQLLLAPWQPEDSRR